MAWPCPLGPRAKLLPDRRFSFSNRNSQFRPAFRTDRRRRRDRYRRFTALRGSLACRENLLQPKLPASPPVRFAPEFDGNDGSFLARVASMRHQIPMRPIPPDLGNNMVDLRPVLGDLERSVDLGDRPRQLRCASRLRSMRSKSIFPPMPGSCGQRASPSLPMSMSSRSPYLCAPCGSSTSK